MIKLIIEGHQKSINEFTLQICHTNERLVNDWHHRQVRSVNY